MIKVIRHGEQLGSSRARANTRRYGRQSGPCGVARRRAEPGDLCATVRIARRPVDVRICVMSGRYRDSSTYHATWAD